MEIKIGSGHQEKNPPNFKTHNTKKYIRNHRSASRSSLSALKCDWGWTILPSTYMNKNFPYFYLTMFLKFQNILEAAC